MQLSMPALSTLRDVQKRLQGVQIFGRQVIKCKGLQHARLLPALFALFVRPFYRLLQHKCRISMCLYAIAVQGTAL